MSTEHNRQLMLHCRVCAGKLGRVSYTCSQSEKCRSLLSVSFGIDTESDNPNIHPPKTCNKCYAIMKIIEVGTVSSLHPFPFTEHFDGCGTCMYFSTLSKGGRPSKKATQIPTGHIRSCAGPKLSGKTFSLLLSRFCPPPPGSISLKDIQCPICMCIVDQPVEMPCKVPAWMECFLWLVQRGEIRTCPSCRKEHNIEVSPIPSLILKLLLQQVLYCTCSNPVRLEHLREHLNSSCKELVADTPFILTLEQVLDQPLGTPPSSLEKQAAGHIVKTMLQQSPDADTITVPTGGHVSVDTCTCIYMNIEAS